MNSKDFFRAICDKNVKNKINSNIKKANGDTKTDTKNDSNDGEEADIPSINDFFSAAPSILPLNSARVNKLENIRYIKSGTRMNSKIKNP